MYGFHLGADTGQVPVIFQIPYPAPPPHTKKQPANADCHLGTCMNLSTWSVHRLTAQNGMFLNIVLNASKRFYNDNFLTNSSAVILKNSIFHPSFFLHSRLMQAFFSRVLPVPILCSEITASRALIHAPWDTAATEP